MSNLSTTDKIICKVAYKSKTIKERYGQYGIYLMFIFGILTTVGSLYNIFIPVFPNLFPSMINIYFSVVLFLGGCGIMFCIAEEIFLFSLSQFHKYMTYIFIVFLIAAIPLCLWVFIKIAETSIITILLLAIVGTIEVISLKYIFENILLWPDRLI